MAEKVYTVQEVKDSLYINKAGKPVNGYMVTFLAHEFDTVYSVNVPKMDAKIVDDAALAIIHQRRIIEALGNEAE